MTCIKDLVFRAFRRLHNDDDDGDIYLPPDAPDELLVPPLGPGGPEELMVALLKEATSETRDETISSLDLVEGFWIKNCNVWISVEQIKEQLEQWGEYDL